jgi:serum/glucocorticoid-regulated kinase 2
MSHLTLDDFDLVKVIGKGGFSKVFQVRKKDSGKIYAMKTISKGKIKKDNKVENILNERAILSRVQHPFIIKMKYAFQNVIIFTHLVG